MKEKVGGLEAKCDIHHRAHVKLRDQISHIFPDSPSLSLWFSVGTTHIKSVWL